MAWTWTRPSAGLSTGALAEYVGDALSRLKQIVMCYERVAVLTYEATVFVSGNVSRVNTLEVSDNSNFTIANPTSPREGARIVIDIHNNSGGAMGTITWGSEYQMSGTFAEPADGTHRLVEFYRTVDGFWREMWTSAADI